MPSNCVALLAVTTTTIAEFHDLPLLPHPTRGASPLRALSVSGALSASGQITLDYQLHGELLRLRLPEPARNPQRRDELWRHTCLELFARRATEVAYLEFNFSPSGDWAAYRFEGYRRGQHPFDQQPLGITVHPLGPGQLRIQARATLPAKPRQATPGAADPQWRLGLAAVIEASDGTVTHWATRHAGAQPDFHAPENFSLGLVPAASARQARAAMP